MGIRGLTAFMNDKYDRWVIAPVNSIKKLVIDGNNLCYKLFHENGHEWTHGGDYPGFSRTVTAFFSTLQLCGVDAVVILDGIDYKEEKIATVRKRRENEFELIRRHQLGRSVSEASVLPILAKCVFTDSLHDAGIPFYVVDGEADEEIVAVANYYRCPVLAEDSDFYIFNIEGGYIPLQYFLDSQMSKVRVYYAPNFAEQFAFQDPALRFLIPAILGNDILKKVPYPGFDKLTTLIKSISQYPTLKEFLDQVPDRVDRKSLHENCRKAAALYGVKLVRNPAELSGFTNLNLPKWILDRYRKGCFAPQMVLAAMTQKIILSTVVDDIKSRCAQYVGLRIRQHIYGILVHQPVQESMRDEKSTTLTDHLTKYRMLKPSLSLKEVSDLKVTEATQILCSVLCCYEAVDRIEELPKEWRLVAASCIYWYRKAKPTPQHHLVKALVLCLILCKDSVFPILGQNVAQSNGSFLEALHAFAQWQCTYFDAVALNQLLMEPFQYTSPAYLYSGEIAMQCAALCSRSEMPTLKLTQDQSKLYDCLMALIKSGSEHGTKTGLQREKELTKQMAPAETVAHKNRFELFMHMQESSSAKK